MYVSVREIKASKDCSSYSYSVSSPACHRPPFFPSLLTSFHLHKTLTAGNGITCDTRCRVCITANISSIMLPLTRQQIPFIAQVFCLLLPVPSISLVITEGAVLSGDRVRHKATGNDVTAGGDSADSYSTLRFLQEDVCMIITCMLSMTITRNDDGITVR